MEAGESGLSGEGMQALCSFPRLCLMYLFTWPLVSILYQYFNKMVNLHVSLSSGSCCSKFKEPKEEVIGTSNLQVGWSLELASEVGRRDHLVGLSLTPWHLIQSPHSVRMELNSQTLCWYLRNAWW